MRPPVRFQAPLHEEICCRWPRPFSRPLSATVRPIDKARSETFTSFGDHLLIVATDRISAFDYVLGSGIPDKGKVLTQISAFWFDRTRAIVPNHVVSTDPATYPEPAAAAADWLRGRSMLVRRTEPLPIECVARGYLFRLRLEGLHRERRGLRHSLAGRTARVGTAPRADLYTGDQGRRAATTSISARRRRQSSSAGGSSTAPAN